MKTNLWLVIVVIVGFLGFLIGYSQSRYEDPSPAVTGPAVSGLEKQTTEQ